ncbi:hypothetical protein [Mesorhizobium sp.]|uniref:hypothetical protein n=1 Tax=Mesorhizobium sp. TaxID=1871066 RepID=UPI000FE83501|nr:hypothetical protein [Mesorhizobium sp.]RWG75630.1 MAG: hypothetical protein EOQ68_25945 [Mesorhizobium sp.]
MRQIAVLRTGRYDVEGAADRQQRHRHTIGARQLAGRVTIVGQRRDLAEMNGEHRRIDRARSCVQGLQAKFRFRAGGLRVGSVDLEKVMAEDFQILDLCVMRGDPVRTLRGRVAERQQAEQGQGEQPGKGHGFPLDRDPARCR